MHSIHHRRGVFVLMGLVAFLVSSPKWLFADDWAQFLGPDRNGVSQETGLIDQWPADGLEVVWRVPGGVGMSAVVVADGQAITLVQDDQSQYLLSLDAKTGDTNWKQPIAPAYRNQMGNGPRATPAVSDGVVFAFSGEGVLAAYGVDSGDERWSVDTIDLLGGKTADYGMASSPLVIDNQVIVTVGAPDATVASFDVSDGSLNWKAGSDRTGYSSATLLNIEGTKQLVTYTGNSVIAIAPQSGDILWRYPYETDYDCNIATPLMIDEKVFISSGENHGCVSLAISKQGDRYVVSETWSSQGRSSVMRNEWQTSILWDGFLYGFDNVGSASAVTHLACIDPANGERMWQEIRFGKGNHIAADGKLIMTTMDGDVAMVRITPEGFEELGREQLIGPTRQAPSLSNGFLFVRDDDEIVCIDLRAK